jgi:hypothetical protein
MLFLIPEVIDKGEDKGKGNPVTGPEGPIR